MERQKTQNSWDDIEIEQNWQTDTSQLNHLLYYTLFTNKIMASIYGK